MANAGRGLQPESIELLRTGLRIVALRALGDPDAAEEAVQESLARALVAIHEGRLREAEKLGPFVRGIARHVIADVIRERKRSARLAAAPEAVRNANPDDPLSALISAEKRDRVRRVLTRLSAGDQQILHLCFFEDLSPAEIAERSGEPASRIWKRKSRALARLRQALSETGSGQDLGAPTTDIADR